MRDPNRWLNQWVQESRRALPLLQAWRDALVRRDLAAIDALHARLQPTLQRLERLRADRPALSDTLSSDTLQQALEVARTLDEVIQSAYDIILNELDYTHALIAMLTRAAEGEHYAPLSAPRAPSTLLNTEV
ncbi:MAG: hypothetical protein NZL85_02095 [Fimbriimonadales bacterium]|nr:hypothetical protein [Fimbriimonadales bacterium]